MDPPRKKRSNTRGSASGGMPIPVSVTSIRTMALSEQKSYRHRSARLCMCHRIRDQVSYCPLHPGPVPVPRWPAHRPTWCSKEIPPSSQPRLRNTPAHHPGNSATSTRSRRTCARGLSARAKKQKVTNQVRQAHRFFPRRFQHILISVDDLRARAQCNFGFAADVWSPASAGHAQYRQRTAIYDRRNPPANPTSR